MIISSRQRFVLLETWKAASSTAALWLGPYDDNCYNRFYDNNPYLQRVVHRHLTYSEFAALPESRLGYFTGAFVRNPYDRVYSGFLQLQRDIRQQPLEQYSKPWIKALVMCQLADNLAQIKAADFEFDKWLALVKEHQIYDIGRNSSFPLHPAHYWTGIDQERKVDFVGKVEDFEHDFDAFCAQVGMAPAKSESLNVTNLPELGDPARYRYVTRMNDASIAKINTLFAADFELFGYEVLTEPQDFPSIPGNAMAFK